MIGSPTQQPNTNFSRGPQDPFLNNLAQSNFPFALDQDIYVKDPRVVLRQLKSDKPSEPTSWSWNIRAGDRITVGVQNNLQYVIAGPTAPFTPPSQNYNKYDYNPDRFINLGPPAIMVGYQLPTVYPNSLSPLYYPSEILYVVNEGNRMFDGVDNNGDGAIDPAFDGVDNDGNGYIDDPAELFYAEFNGTLIDPVNEVKVLLANGFNDHDIIDRLKATYEWDPIVINQGAPDALTSPPITPLTGASIAQQYTIKRRMVPSANSAEVGLPADVVIDATTAVEWIYANNPNKGYLALVPPNINSTSVVTTMAERSRLPIDPLTRYVDIIFQPDGQVVTSAASSVNNSPFQVPFYHLWLCDRADVFSPTDPNQAVGSIYTPRLPLPEGVVLQSQHVNLNNGEWVLKNERRLITIQTRTGRISSQSVEFFDPTDSSVPYADAQRGIAEVGQ